MANINTSKNTYKAPPKPAPKPAPKTTAYIPDKPKPKPVPVSKQKEIYKDHHKPVVAPKPAPPKAAPKGKMADIYKDMHKPVAPPKAAPPKVTAKPLPVTTKPKVTAKPLPTVKLPVATKPKAVPPKTKTAPPKTTTAPPKAPIATKPPVTAPPKVVAPPPVAKRDANGTVGPTNNGKDNWNSNQSIPDYGAMQPDMIKAIEAGYANGGRQYDPNTDPAYQAQLLLANKQADAAGLSTMEDMNDRGILNSTITSDRVGQIKQGASDAVIGNIPGMQANYNEQQARNQAGYSDLLKTVMGGGQFQQEFAEGNRRFDKNYQLDEADITGTYNSAEAIARGQVQPGFGIETLEKQGQLADQKFSNDKLAFEKDAFGRELQYKKDTFNREMNFQEQDSMIKHDLASRGLDLEAIKIGTDRFMAESDADYKQRQIASNVTEVEAKTNTNRAIGNILGVDSLSEGFAFIESQTNSWASSGVDIRSVIDALESKFPGSKEVLASSGGGGGTSSYFGP